MFTLTPLMQRRNSGFILRFGSQTVPVLIVGPWRHWSASWKETGSGLKGRGMSISAETLRFDDHTMWVELSDGRTIGVPLAWFPRLLNASPDQRARYRISVTGRGLHWDELDEDISVAGLLEGRGDLTQRQRPAA